MSSQTLVQPEAISSSMATPLSFSEFMIDEQYHVPCYGLEPYRGEAITKGMNIHQLFPAPFLNIYHRLFNGNGDGGSDRISAMLALIGIFEACLVRQIGSAPETLRDMGHRLFSYSPGLLRRTVMVQITNHSFTLQFEDDKSLIVQMRYPSDQPLLSNYLAKKCRENWPNVWVQVVKPDKPVRYQKTKK